VPAHKASPVQLSAEHQRELHDLVPADSTPQKLAERARIILLAATGLVRHVHRFCGDLAFR
jgi:hypothetical protein